MVNRVTGHVFDGHARIEDAISRREPTVPVAYVDLSEDEEPLVLASSRPRRSAGAATAWRSSRCQVVIERWQGLTGQTAERIEP
jgi:hypothetical protein